MKIYCYTDSESVYCFAEEYKPTDKMKFFQEFEAVETAESPKRLDFHNRRKRINVGDIVFVNYLKIHVRRTE